jgi:hypothetical protein
MNTQIYHCQLIVNFILLVQINPLEGLKMILLFLDQL